MKIVQINILANGSTGKIMLDIAKLVTKQGGSVKTFSAYVYSKKFYRLPTPPANHQYFGSYFENAVHTILGQVTGLNGWFSYFGTLKLIKECKLFQPDIIHLHNLHAFCINLPLLFNYIKKHNIPVVWTLHDCWAFTGHCPYFTIVKCDKWKTGCRGCPQLEVYPKARIDNTKFAYELKKKWFTGVQNMTIVTPSQWLADLVKESFLKEYPIKVINNGIDLDVFKPTESDFREVYGLQGKKIVLGVAFGWGDRKGYKDCLKLAELLNDKYHMVLVGVSKEQIATLPKNVLGIERTNSQKELAEIYSASDVFMNTTYEDNYPTVNLEARACGLPVITYKTGGSPESAGADAIIVEVGDIEGLKKAVETTVKRDPAIKREELSSEAKLAEYIDLYNVQNS